MIIKKPTTRMHSSRMPTVCCSSHLLGGGVCLPGGVSPGCVCPVGCLPRRGVSALGCVCTPSPHGQNSWHTLVKTLPFCNLRTVMNKSSVWTAPYYGEFSLLSLTYFVCQCCNIVNVLWKTFTNRFDVWQMKFLSVIQFLSQCKWISMKMNKYQVKTPVLST